MSRTVRASIAAGFTYVRFAVTLVAGLWLVPFVLGHVGVRLYGFWLATGELLGYAGLADFGVLVTLPWLVAEADGRSDRGKLRALLSTGIGAAALSGLAYAAIASIVWFTFPDLLHIEAAERAQVAGPLLVVAAAGALTLPLRAFGSVLTGLQDVRFSGTLALVNWLLGFVITVVMLIQGHGLYALAWAAVVPSVITGVVSYIRLRAIAPDLFHDWPVPSWHDMRRMFAEGIGTWFGALGWRLVAASNSIVLGALGRPGLVAALACTTKLADALVQLSWIPCDNGLIGLAQLSGENQLRRLRDALVIMMRVYLALSGAVACVIIAANPAFVHAWVGPDMFASMTTNTMIAALAITMSFAHAVAVIPSVLGKRLEIGLATLASGALHLVIAWSLGMYYGPAGVVLAGIISHGLVFCALAWRPFAAATGTTELALAADVLKPWAWRIVPMIALAFVVQRAIGLPSMPVTIAVGAAMGLLVVFFMRPLYIEFGPVRALYDRVMRWAT